MLGVGVVVVEGKEGEEVLVGSKGDQMLVSTGLGQFEAVHEPTDGEGGHVGQWLHCGQLCCQYQTCRNTAVLLDT